jgi:hypothetical protein
MFFTWNKLVGFMFPKIGIIDHGFLFPTSPMQPMIPIRNDLPSKTSLQADIILSLAGAPACSEIRQWMV